jgi:hypothetical protein
MSPKDETKDHSTTNKIWYLKGRPEEENFSQ